MPTIDLSILNSNDIKDFVSSLDKAIKICFSLEKEENLKIVPKVMLGENRDFLSNQKQLSYERPFLSVFLTRREPSSLSDTNFFVGMKQHGASFRNVVNTFNEASEISYFRRDNELTMILRAKTKSEIFHCLQVIERIFMLPEIKKLLNCEICHFVSLKENRNIEDDLYSAEIKINVRTTITLMAIDNVVLEKVSIYNTKGLCKFYDLSTQSCSCKKITGFEAEKEDLATDVKCYFGTDWCKDYVADTNNN